MPQGARIKILYIHQDGLITGSAISLYNLLAGLRDTIVDPYLVLAMDGPAKQFFETLRIPVHVIPMYGFWTTPGPKWYQLGSLHNYKALRKNSALYRFASMLKPDLIHINDKAALNAGISLRGLNIPIVQHLRSSYFTCNFPLFKHISSAVIRKYASYLIAISEDEIDGFEQYPNLAVIYNSVDIEAADKAIMERESTRRSLGVGADELLIGYVGIFSGIRGAWDFIKACDYLLRHYPGLAAKFIMMGKLPVAGNAKHGMLSRFRKPESASDIFHSLRGKLGDRLITPGHTKEPLRFIAAMDLLVITSHLGVMGRQPLEAQSVGVPVVGYNGHSRKTSVVSPDKTGTLVDRWDPHMLAERIADLVRNRQLQNKMSAEAIRYSREKFDPVANGQKVLRIYKELLGYN